MAMAAVAAGADGLIIEVHNDPKNALCDGAQSLTPEQFEGVIGQAGRSGPLCGPGGVSHGGSGETAMAHAWWAWA